MDLVVDVAGGLELFEAKWNEVPGAGDTANLDFVRHAAGESGIGSGAVVCRAPNSFPLAGGFRALPVTEFG